MQANRNKRVYGPIASIEALHAYVKEVGAKLGVTIEAFASNHEGCILDEIHRTAAQCDARCAGFAQKALNDRK
jgi:3-dehydroquinate dehydratase II